MQTSIRKKSNTLQIINKFSFCMQQWLSTFAFHRGFPSLHLPWVLVSSYYNYVIISISILYLKGVQSILVKNSFLIAYVISKTRSCWSKACRSSLAWGLKLFKSKIPSAWIVCMVIIRPGLAIGCTERISGGKDTKKRLVWPVANYKTQLEFFETLLEFYPYLG